MEDVSLLTQKHLFITTTDKHGVPPTKRLFKVAMLDPIPRIQLSLGKVWRSGTTSVDLDYGEWSIPAGLKLARENLQSRVKEEDSITDVENAIFYLRVMDSLCFLFIDQRVFVGMITKFIKFVELNFSVITHCFDIKVCMLKGPNSFQTTDGYSTCPLVCGVIRGGGGDEWTHIYSMTLKLVIAKMVSAITYVARGAPNWRREF
ncbi:hypothetical protein Tco_0040994 [Tanacetum coccineum]